MDGSLRQERHGEDAMSSLFDPAFDQRMRRGDDGLADATEQDAIVADEENRQMQRRARDEIEGETALARLGRASDQQSETVDGDGRRMDRETIVRLRSVNRHRARPAAKY